MVNMLSFNELKKYYKDKKVLITGHTGFKGSYLCVLLKYLGAKVYGYSLKPEKDGLYFLLSKDIRNLKKTSAKQKASEGLVCDELFADIRDVKKLTSFIRTIRPDYIIHMAAQPLVLYGYDEPRYTYEVNVMGTVNLLDAIKEVYSKKSKSNETLSILNVTTDKVYENNDLSNYAFKETDKLCGRDPYANSKSCSELVTYSYKESFFSDKKTFRLSTARAGNVVGGGDLNANRIIPDCYRAIKKHNDMFVRNPYSIRPYQFVLEPLILYLNILALQKKNVKYEGNYNIGPNKESCFTTEKLVRAFFDALGQNYEINKYIEGTKHKKCFMPKVIYNKKKNRSSLHEAAYLRLDNSKIKKMFAYKEIYSIDKTMHFTSKVYLDMLYNNNIYDSIISVIEEAFN